MSEILDRDATQPLSVGGDMLAAVTHVPAAVSPVETPAVMEASPALVAITQDAAAWAARVQRRPARVHPEILFEVAGTLNPTVYTPDGVAAASGWKTKLLSPPVQDTGYPGDAGGFTRGIRGPQSALPPDTREARVAAISCMTVPQPGSSDFRALLSPTSAIVNIWRFGPGAFAIDICIGAGVTRFNRTITCRMRTTDPASLREAYVPAGGFYRPIGAKVSLNKTARNEVSVELDLRRSEIRPLFLRVIVAWEMPVDQAGMSRQCLMALKAPVALSAAEVGEVLAGGAVVGNKAHPISSALNYSFCKVGVAGAVAATSPSGYGVIVGAVDGRSALFGEGGGLTIGISDLQVDSDDHLLMLTFVPVGDWRGSMDSRAVLKLEIEIDGIWQPLSEYVFSNDTAYVQSYPSRKGKGVAAAMSGVEAINQYQFGEDTPMLTLPPAPPPAPSPVPVEPTVPIRPQPPVVVPRPPPYVPPTVTPITVQQPPVTLPAVIPTPVPQYAPTPPPAPAPVKPPSGLVTCLALGCPGQPPDPHAPGTGGGGWRAPCLMPAGCRGGGPV